MHKRVVLALMLALALLMSTSCSLIIKDEAVDMATPVIEVAGQTFTKGEVRQLTESYLDYNEYMYNYYYGYAYDRTSEAAIADAQEQAIQNLIETAVVDAKLAEYGFDTLGEEEQAEVEQLAQEDYDLYFETVQNFMFYDTELTGDELTAAIEAEMANMGYPDYETLVKEYVYSQKQEKLIAEINKDVTVSEEELATEYAARVEEARSNYEASPAAYGTDITNGETPYYTPEGYRYVKHILLEFAQEDEDAISALEDQIAALEEGADAAELNAQLEAAREQAYANLQPRVDEIAAKLAEGAAFDDLIAEYNEDPGMDDETQGYAVSASSTDWVAEFQNAAMALENVGDVSQPVRSEYGIHIIRYQSDIEAGEIGIENVFEALTEEQQSEKESANTEATLARWVEEANAKINEKELSR